MEGYGEQRELLDKIRYFLNVDTYYRFLIARDFKVDKSFEMLKKSIAWRVDFKPDEIQAT